MAEASGGEKTLPASPRKKQKAREKGNVTRSQDLSAAWSLIMALALFSLLGPGMWRLLVEATRHYFGILGSLPIAPESVQVFSAGVLFRLGRIVVPFMVLMMAAGLTINVMQVGILFTTEPLTPKLEKLNVVTGMKKFVSPRTAMELVKSIFKLTIIGFVVYSALRNRWDQVLRLPYLPPQGIVTSVAAVLFAVWLRVAIVMIILGVLDFAFQWWMRERDLRMTTQEAKEEMKDMEGNPQIRRRIREIQRRMAYQRMMAEVPTADVVVTNPTRFAVALRYDFHEMDAPVVVAKGARLVAARIRELAVENGVPIVEKPELARALYRTIEVGQPVPESLFRAVAEVLAFVYQIDRRADKVRERNQAFAPAGRPAA